MTSLYCPESNRSYNNCSVQVLVMVPTANVDLEGLREDAASGLVLNLDLASIVFWNMPIERVEGMEPSGDWFELTLTVPSTFTPGQGKAFARKPPSQDWLELTIDVPSEVPNA